MAHDTTPPPASTLSPEERRQFCAHIVELDRPGLMRLVRRYEATVADLILALADKEARRQAWQMTAEKHALTRDRIAGTPEED